MAILVYCLLIVLGGLSVWFSGAQLVFYVDKLADKLGLGKAFLGALLLGGITSLPEVSTTIVASYLGNGALAAANLLGGVSMQTAILAMADLFILKQALTYVSPKPVLILSGVLLISQLAFVIICVSVGEIFSIFNVGLWAILNFAIFLIFLFVMKKYEGQERWIARDLPEISPKVRKKKETNRTVKQMIFRIVLHSFPVFIGGMVISYSANELVSITGISSTLIGASLLAIITSLPEVTTTFYAISFGAYTLAISNIIGSNSLMIGLLFLSDLFYSEELIFNTLTTSTVFISAIGILVTAAYLWGLLERKNKTIFRMGIDSIIVILIEALGLITLYFMD